jgi:hypothetical protein
MSSAEKTYLFLWKYVLDSILPPVSLKQPLTLRRLRPEKLTHTQLVKKLLDF